MSSLIGLGCAKFNPYNRLADAAFISVDTRDGSAKKWSKLAFPSAADTQDFTLTENALVVCHHTSFKALPQVFGNVEIYPFVLGAEDLLAKDGPFLLPNEAQLDFPTCLCVENEWLVVGQAGRGFRSAVHIYDASNPMAVKLNQTVLLDSNKRRNPSGLYFDGELLVVCYYLDSSIDYFEINLDRGNATHIDTKRSPLLSAPLSFAKLGSELYLTSHANDRLLHLEFNSTCDEINAVELLGPGCSSPWGVCEHDGKLYVSNLALNTRSNPFILELTKITVTKLKSKKLLEHSPVNEGSGFTMLVSKPDNHLFAPPAKNIPPIFQ